MNLAEQKKIISDILGEASARARASMIVIKTLAELETALQEKESMREVVELINAALANLEQIDEAKQTIAFFKEKGLYKMLYHHPKIRGEELPSDDILSKMMRLGFIGIGVSAFLVAAFATIMLVGAPFWLIALSSGLFVGASTYLSGILYGVVNDLFAAHANLPYFLLGHQPQQTSLLRTNDKIAQGVAWGVAATFGPVLIASIVFTLAATISAFFVPMATFALPFMTIAMPLIAFGAEFYARKQARVYVQLEADLETEKNLQQFTNSYQYNGLRFMSLTTNDRAAWFANSDRNTFGFTKVPLIGLVVLVALITLSAASMFLPAILFTAPLIAVILPVACSGLAALLLAGGGLYTYYNRNRQIDDRCNLHFGEGPVIDDLYLSGDELGDELKGYKTDATPEPETGPTNYPSPVPRTNTASASDINRDSSPSLSF